MMPSLEKSKKKIYEQIFSSYWIFECQGRGTCSNIATEALVK